MIKVSCILTDIDGELHYSIEDLIDADLESVETACISACNSVGDFMSFKDSGGVMTIPKNRIKQVKYSIIDIGDDK